MQGPGGADIAAIGRLTVGPGAVRNVFADELAPRVIAHADHDPAICGLHPLGVLVFETALNSVLDRAAGRVGGVDFGESAMAVRLVGRVREVVARVELFIGIAALGADAVAGAPSGRALDLARPRSQSAHARHASPMATFRGIAGTEKGRCAPMRPVLSSSVFPFPCPHLRAICRNVPGPYPSARPAAGATKTGHRTPCNLPPGAMASLTG